MAHTKYTIRLITPKSYFRYNILLYATLGSSLSRPILYYNNKISQGFTGIVILEILHLDALQ